MISSCKKEKTEDQPQVVSNVTSYYSTPLTPIKSATVSQAAASNATTYQIDKGSGLSIGEDVTLTINGPNYGISSINTSNPYYDVITVPETLGPASVGDHISDRTTFLTVFDGMTLKINVTGIPVCLYEGESYVASVEDIEGIGNPYSIAQTHNFFDITMTYPEYIDQVKEANEMHSYDLAFESYAQSLSTQNPKPVPIVSDYVKYDWATPSNTQIFSGKFIIRKTSANMTFALYVAEQGYPTTVPICDI